MSDRGTTNTRDEIQQRDWLTRFSDPRSQLTRYPDLSVQEVREAVMRDLLRLEMAERMAKRAA